MPTNITHLSDLVQENKYQSLIGLDDVDNIKKLQEYTDCSNNLVVIKNFTTGEKNYAISMGGSPVFFGQFKTKVDSRLFDRMSLYVIEFDSEDVTTVRSEVFFFASTLLENSYDSTSIGRDSVKTIMDSYYSYDEDLLTPCFDAFDGGTATFIEGIRINRKEEVNTVFCYELGTNEEDRDFNRNANVLRKIAKLYDYDENNIETWIEDYREVLGNRNTRLCYQLKQSGDKKPPEIEIQVLPIDPQVFMQSHNEIAKTFKDMGLIEEKTWLELIDWTDFTFRKLSHFNLRLNKGSNGIETELTAYYAILFEELMPQPNWCNPYLDEEYQAGVSSGGDYVRKDWIKDGADVGAHIAPKKLPTPAEPEPAHPDNPEFEEE